MRRIIKLASFVTVFSAGIVVGAVAIIAAGGENGTNTKDNAQENVKEDLSSCQLPHGELTLFDRNAPEGSKGYFLRFSDGTLNLPPATGAQRPPTVAGYFKQLQDAKIGDLMYSPLNKGSLVAVSGRMADLGGHFLHDFNARSLERPSKIFSKQERSGKGEATPGVIDGVLNGHCFLVETVDGKYALIRIVQQRDRSALIQYVYQPDGSRQFAIPQGKITSIAPPPGDPSKEPKSAMPFGVERLDPADFSKAVAVHGENRKKMIALSIQLLEVNKGSLDAVLVNRHYAAIFLGKIRAAEAAPTLAAHVDDNLALVSLRITVENSYRCVQSLIDIGIPGAKAAVKQIELDASAAPPNGVQPRDWNDRQTQRRNLLALVVLKVYGERLAKIVLEDRIAEVADEKAKTALKEAAAAFPRVSRWLPDEVPADKPTR
jgi:hypothetical protein